MTRVKRGTTSLKRRRSVLNRTKGYRNARKSKERQAKEAYIHAGVHSFNHRKAKKGDFRRLWQVKINAATRASGLSYSKFIGSLTKARVGVDRKILADLAENNPDTFKRIVEKVS